MAEQQKPVAPAPNASRKPPKKMEFKLLGHNYQTPDLVAKVTGKAKYAEDYRADGMVFIKLMPSPRPHAKIRSIDASAALAMPGVHGILTAKDLPAPPPPPGGPPAAAPAARPAGAPAAGAAPAAGGAAPAAGGAAGTARVRPRHPRPARRLHKPQLQVVVVLLPPRPRLPARPRRLRRRRPRCRPSSR